ncbi:MAG: DUF2065 domain-containing protein [Burkholderiales bacterium]|nr:DUF2065 domain-containing protein [Burkholderiales bacterium]
MQGNVAMALALVLVLEGVLPFTAPGLWKETFLKLANLTNGQVRFVGLLSMLFGLTLLFVFNT